MIACMRSRSLLSAALRGRGSRGSDGVGDGPLARGRPMVRTKVRTDPERLSIA